MGALAPDRIMGIKKLRFGNKGGWVMTFWTKQNKRINTLKKKKFLIKFLDKAQKINTSND